MIDVSFETYKDEVAIQIFVGEEKLPTIHTDFVGAADVLGQLATAYKIEDLFAVIQDNKPMSLNMIRYDKKFDFMVCGEGLFIDLTEFGTDIVERFKFGEKLKRLMLKVENDRK